MPLPRFELTDSCRVDVSRDEVFAFFSDASNLEKITPPWMRFQIVTPAPIDMKVGTLIDYRMRVHGIPMRWRSRISVWDPPHRFVDEQIRGPYRTWIHEHRFEEDGEGTICTDHVRYDLPFAWLVHRFFVRRDLDQIFAFRRQTITGLFSSPAQA